LCSAVRRWTWLSACQSWLTAWLPLFYAALDELHQSFVPPRQALLSDWLIDVAGILLALGLIWIWEHRHALLPGQLIPLPVRLRDR